MPRPKPTFPRLNKSHQLSQGLVSAWGYYEGSGSSLNDLSGQSARGTFTSPGTLPSWTKGQSGYAINFPNAGYIDHGSANYGLANKSFSVLIVLKRNASGGSSETIWGQGSVADTDKSLHLHFFNDLFVFGFFGDDLITVGSFPDTTNWHTWVATYDTGNKAKNLYQDGVNVGQSTAAANFSGDSTTWTGKGPYGGDPYNGLIDHVLVYNRVLSLAEIKALSSDSWAVYRQPDNRAMFGPYASAGAPPPTTAQIYPAMQGQLNSGGFVGTRWV